MSWPGLSSRFDLPASRATRWQLRQRLLDLPRRPLVMGIVNVTPDSFSDGGEFFDAPRAVDHALALVAQGADLLDIGGESTRPYAEPVSESEELRRVMPVIMALAEQVTVPLSIDTSKAFVARESLAAGVELINDVTALAGDPEMLPLAAETQAGVCLMHMQGTPQNMQDNPQYQDVVGEVLAYLSSRREACLAAGIRPECIALDPGIGFGKTHAHNFALLAHCVRFHELGCPLLVGPSRKAIIGKLMDDKQADRMAGTIGAVLALAVQGVQIVRVHDVQATRHAIQVFEALGGLMGEPTSLQ